MNGYVVVLFCLIISFIDAKYILTGTPPNLIVGEDVTITLECRTLETLIKFSRDKLGIAIIKNPTGGSCSFDGTPNSNYMYSCDSDNGIYLLSTNITVKAGFNSVPWDCGHVVTITAKTFYFNVSVPVTKVTIMPAGSNNFTDIVLGDTVTFICTTDPSCPAASIQWYIGTQNETSSSKPQTPQINGSNFISSSKLNYTGTDDDHNKIIYCEALNIEGRDKVASQKNNIYIQTPVTNVTITPPGDSNVVNVVEGKTEKFICTTDASRPAAWIHWYIGTHDVTNQTTPQISEHDGEKFTTSSTLTYTGKEDDHNNTIYCEALNIAGKVKVMSQKREIYIQKPVLTVTIAPVSDNNLIVVLNGTVMTFTCTTGLSRPAALIQWYFGEQNVTDSAKPKQPQVDDGKFISSSELKYALKATDHNKTLYCQAVNIKNEKIVTSTVNTIYIQIPVTTVDITPSYENNVVYVIEGHIWTLTCTTSLSRPASLIQWYIGGQSVANQTQIIQQNEDKFITTSLLKYNGLDRDHNKIIFCKATNIAEILPIRSLNISLFIKLPVTTAEITPAGDNNVTYVVEGHIWNFTCTTGFSRPAASIQWYIGEKNVTNQALPQNSQETKDKFQSTSVLKYIGHDRDHKKPVFCTAANIAEEGHVNSLDILIFIKFGPKNISLDTTTVEYTVTENSGIETINCSANCRPDCTYNWTGPNGFEKNGVSLQLGPVFRNQTGKYFCNARNDFGFLSFHGITIIVNYSPSIVSLTVNNETSENSSAIFQCNIDSHPASTITWTNGNTVLKTNVNVKKSIYTISNARCLQTGTYQCQANNTIHGTIWSKIGQIDLFVLCSVRHDKRKPDIPDQIGINDDDLFHVTLYLIAYPEPAIQWSFKNESVKSNDSIGSFEHHTSILKRKIGTKDYGIYTLYAYNQIGEPYLREFNVFPQRKPAPPSNITIKCDIISMQVFWRSESNGGNKQTFTVSWWDQEKNKTTYSRDIEDLGEGKYHSETTHSLDPNTLYFVFVDASNNHGLVTSHEHVNCTTKQKPTEDSFAVGALVGGILGAICGVIVISAAILIYFRHTKYSKHDREPIRRNNNFEVTDEDDDELKDNPLYMSSGQASGVDNGPLYSIVNRKPQSETEKTTTQNVDQGPVYSHIQKQDKKGRQERNEKKAKKHDKKEQNGSGIELGSVYENSELRSNINQSDCVLHTNSDRKDSPSLTKDNYRPSKNKDGLIYADLDLAPGPTGKRFVIRGLENKNNYAIIDLTKSAEPLPSSDEDDEKENR